MTGSAGQAGILSIELEDSLSRLRWWSPIRLFSQTAMQQWHFVGLMDGRLRYESPTFAAPYGWGVLPLGRTVLPREEWAPGMQAALDELREEIAADGWTENSCGDQPWQHRYRRSG
jgi:hypothetical protein